MRSSVLVSGVVLAALSLAAVSLTASTACAQESEYPVSYVERPLTLPRFALAPFVELDVDHITFSGNTTSGYVTLAGMQIGASFGITKDLEVGAVVLPIQFNDGAGYGGIFVGEEGTSGNPSVYATYRFLHAPSFDLGARLRLQFVTPHEGIGGGAQIEPSVPFLLHIGKIARFDAEVGIPITVVGGSTTTTVVNGTVVTTTAGGNVEVGVDIPLKLAFDIIEPLHVGVSTGLAVDDLGHASDTTRIPIGVFAGYAIGEKRPIVDIDPFLVFYDFLTPGASGPGSSTVNPGVVVFGVNARGYLYF